MITKITSKTVYVGMSGGVDSSVAAALLKKQGFNVIGVFMKQWSPYAKASEGHSNQEDFCLWKQEREDAMRSAVALGIPFKTWDFSKEYEKEIVSYMIREYKAGRTPNPDVMCNKEIKFGLFLKRALKEGADFIATGHYVRLKRTSKKLKVLKVRKGLYKLYKPDELYNYHLLKAKDDNKDQSYFLWTLTQEQLKYCLFPIGDLLKPEVRKLAKKFKLPNHSKKDSQGVCFIGPLDMKSFLISYIKPKKGKIIKDGEVIGEHDGVYYYTIGQRHGLDIKIGGGPYYVTSKDIKKNIICVGENKKTVSKAARITDINWLVNPHTSARTSKSVLVKVRYRTESVKAVLDAKGVLKFEKPERAVTSGQSAVFYKGKELLGGGIIM